MLRSTRGADGGYYLSRPADQIRLRDIVEAFDGPSEYELPALTGFSSTARSRVLRALREISEAGRAELAKLSLPELLRPSAGGGMGE